MNFEKALPYIKEFLEESITDNNSNILSVIDLGKILKDLNDNNILPSSMSRTRFINSLIDYELVTEYKIELPNKKTTKYIYGSSSKYKLALSLNPKSYICQYTALYLHDLILNVPKSIYTNTEQYKKSISNENIELIQDNIDRAFSRPMRMTNNIAKLNDFNVFLLNGKNVNNIEVINMKINEDVIPITSIERTLIDIVIRPEYAGGVTEILTAYENAKGKFSTGKLIATLNKMDYLYPYHQSIGFYLEKAGYPESILNRFDKLDKRCKFYLTYQMKDKSFSKRWQVYYPSYLNL